MSCLSWTCISIEGLLKWYKLSVKRIKFSKKLCLTNIHNKNWKHLNLLHIIFFFHVWFSLCILIANIFTVFEQDAATCIIWVCSLNVIFKISKQQMIYCQSSWIGYIIYLTAHIFIEQMAFGSKSLYQYFLSSSENK